MTGFRVVSNWLVASLTEYQIEFMALEKGHFSATSPRNLMYGKQALDFWFTTKARLKRLFLPETINCAHDRTMDQTLSKCPRVKPNQEKYMWNFTFSGYIVTLGDSTAILKPVLDRIDLFANFIGLEKNAMKTNALLSD